MTKLKNVDEYIALNLRWKEKLSKLCAIIRTTEMKEMIKWGFLPIYPIKISLELLLLNPMLDYDSIMESY